MCRPPVVTGADDVFTEAAAPGPAGGMRAVLGPVGGDLTVRVIEADGLAGRSRSMYTYARVTVTGPGADYAAQSAAEYASSSPVWNFEATFRDVPATSDLRVEVRQQPHRYTTSFSTWKLEARRGAMACRSHHGRQPRRR
jgi:hypothetical protein